MVMPLLVLLLLLVLVDVAVLVLLLVLLLVLVVVELPPLLLPVANASDIRPADMPATINAAAKTVAAI